MYHKCNAYHKHSESRCLLGLLVLFFYHLPNFTLVTCPISPEFRGNVLRAVSHHTLQCTRPIGPVKRNNYETTNKKNKGTITISNQARNLWGDAKRAVPPNYRTPAALNPGRSPKAHKLDQLALKYGST